MLRLKDAKAGDLVVVYATRYSGLLAVSAAASSMIFGPATLISNSPGTNNFMLAWKAGGGSNPNNPQYGMNTPNSTTLAQYPLLVSGDVFGWYIGDVEVYKINGSLTLGGIQASTVALQEKPCITCKRQNYLNEKVCWSCGNHPFK